MVSMPEDPPLPQTQALVALYHQGRLADVVAQGRRLARQYPRSINICNLLGAANAQLGEAGHAVGDSTIVRGSVPSRRSDAAVGQ